MSSIENMRFKVKRAEEARELIEKLFNLKISQGEIALNIGVAQPTVSCYLKERIAPNPETLAKLRAYAAQVGVK